MAKVNLSPYSIRVREKYSKDFEEINNLFGLGIKIKDIIIDIQKEYLKKPYRDTKSKRALKFNDSVGIPVIYSDLRAKRRKFLSC